MKKKYDSNAERQRAYRKRLRNATKGTVTPIRGKTKRVTKADPKDQCGRLMFLGDWGNGRVYARIVSNSFCPPGKCPLCDQERGG